MGDATSRPVVVSFFTDEDYYRAAAERLRGDCARLGIDSDIRAIDKPPDENWISTCRRKIPFYLEMQRKHGRPILWLDADSRLTAWPAVFDGLSCDLAAFLRGFRYLRGFDRLAVPRFFAPSALFVNTTPQAVAFLELMTRLEREFEGFATDDYFLHEAWMQHEQQLAVTILPPDLVGHEWPLGDRQVIYHGISGNVSVFKAQAAQHEAEYLQPVRRKAVLLHEAAAARRAGQTAEALVLYRRALALDRADDELAAKIVRLMRHQGMQSEASSFLQAYRAQPR
jgi:hypothetical protein